jgi:predicted ATP-grasp superfamily ATP-dependent carboligase
VVALDAFADADTQRLAAKVIKVAYGDGGFDAADLERALQAIDASGVQGMVYGSGFEAMPELLEMTGKHLPVIGNTPRVVRNLKRALQFFTLLDVLQIAHPEISYRPPVKSVGWLTKRGGGSGGTHVRKALPLQQMVQRRGEYFQREMPGQVVSLLFAADGQQAKAIGYNRQWTSPSAMMPYRYGGAVSQADLPDLVRRQLLQAAQRLTSAVGLRGINSIDAIMDGERAWIIEINPRLSATFDLYRSLPGQVSLFDLHLQACAGHLADMPHLAPQARAHHIVYALDDVRLPDTIDWPDWVSDLPLSGSTIAADEPICTILAEGDSADTAQQSLLERANELQNLFNAPV